MQRYTKYLLAGLIAFTWLSSWGLAAEDLPAPAGDSLLTGKKEEPIDYTGDKISYDQAHNILRGEGHVLITHKNMTLKADRVIAYLETSDIYADGNVVMAIGNQVFTGEKVHFNFKTRLGDFINGTGFVDPWYGKGKMIRKSGPNEYQITEGYITSCDYEDPHYKIKAKKIYVYPKERIIARNVTFNLGHLPVFWSPLFTRSLKDQRQRFSFIPGYNRRFGAFLRSGYNFWLDPYLNGTAHADYYSKRGFGTGVSFEYQLGPTATSMPMSGEFKSYDINDKDFQPVLTAPSAVHNHRYGISLKHQQQILPDTRLLAEFHDLSDPDIVNDYFRNEFEEDVQPQTFVDLTKNTENYRLSLYLRKRINNIFDVVERLPELQFQTRDIPMGNTGFYYTNTEDLGYLRHLPLDKPDYESLRLDTFHQFSYPFKVFRFLNLVPRASFRETFYGKGVEKNQIFRSLFSTGVDAFTKIYKGYNDVHSSFWQIDQLRHVIEPKVSYTFTPIPSTRAVQILQFDNIDALDRENFFQFNLRQLLQTRREENAVSIVDADVFINFFPDPKVLTTDRFGNTHRFSDIFLESRFKPLDWVAFNVRGGYDEFNREISQVLLDMAFIHGDDWNVSLRQRMQKGENNLTALEILYRFSEDWVGKAFWRYDFHFSRLEMQEYSLLRDLHCWEVALTFRQRQLRNDYSLFVIFRLKDYPNVPIKFGN